MVSDATLLGIIAGGITLIGLIAKLVYSSKCQKISCCWNCLNIERNIHEEASIRNIITSV
jgi:hypothetical protein